MNALTRGSFMLAAADTVSTCAKLRPSSACAAKNSALLMAKLSISSGENTGAGSRRRLPGFSLTSLMTLKVSMLDRSPCVKRTKRLITRDPFTRATLRKLPVERRSLGQRKNSLPANVLCSWFEVSRYRSSTRSRKCAKRARNAGSVGMREEVDKLGLNTVDQSIVAINTSAFSKPSSVETTRRAA